MIKFKREMRVHYWSSSPLSHWLRSKAGLDNPSALSMEGWDEHKKLCKQKAPVIHYITRTLFNKLQDVVMFPFDIIYSVRVFYKNWKGKTHVLDGGLEVGQWYDLSSRIPLCLFGEFEKFIEVEKGYDTLNWEIGLTYDEDWGYDKENPQYGQPTPQALAAMEQRRIIDWWKANKDRDLDVESGWAQACAKGVQEGSVWGVGGGEEGKQVLDKLAQLEAQYESEQEEMLIALIKIKGHLWT